MAANKNVNTSKSIFKDSGASDTALNTQNFQEGKRLTSSDVKRVPFKCDVIYHSLYPNGFVTTVQGITVTLIFDGRTVMLPDWIATFVKRKITKKAEAEVGKKKRNENPKEALDFLGSY